MTDESIDNADIETASSGRGGAPGSLRKVLIAIIVMLLLGMGVLGYVFVGMLQPAGSPTTQAGTDGGIEWVRSIYGFGPGKDQQLLDPTSAAIAPNGDIYVNDPQRYRVMRFASDGSFRALLTTGGDPGAAGKFYSPASLAVDADGNLYIADPPGGKIIVFNDQGVFQREWKTDRPYGVKVQGDLVYVMTNGLLSVFDRNGAPRGSFGRRGSARDQIDAGQGMAANADRIFIADSFNHRISAFTRQGEVVWVNPDVKPGIDPRSGKSATGATDPKAPFDLPQDLVLDGTGRLVIVDAFKFQLVVADPKNGKVVARYGSSGSEDGLFFYPTGIAYDSARDWFAVVDTRNNRVQIVRIPGTGGGTAAAARRFVTSPWRYCVFPLLLALLALVVAIVTRRRRARALAEAE